jgi:hypothetical protein
MPCAAVAFSGRLPGFPTAVLAVGAGFSLAEARRVLYKSKKAG